MRVVTLNERDFFTACRTLEETVAKDYIPDLIIGIATGGEFVASCMFADAPHRSISRHRPSTADKERASIIFRILRRSPRFISDFLRIAEARILALRKPSPASEPVVPDEKTAAAISSARRILVVDDATDSGATLKAVTDAILAVPGEREVRTAVITVTTSSPLVMPDYTLFHDSTLIRFPWSKDYYPL